MSGVTREWLEDREAAWQKIADAPPIDGDNWPHDVAVRNVELFSLALSALARQGEDKKAAPRTFRFTPPCTPIGDAFDEYMLKSYQTLVLAADKSEAIEGAFKAGWDACLAFVDRRAADEGAVVGILMRGDAVMIGTRIKYEAVILCDTMPADLNDSVLIRRRSVEPAGGEVTENG